MKKIYSLILLAGIFSHSQAQSLSPVVVSTSGGFFSNASAQLSFTTGELTMVQTFTGPNNILTQGFQQPVDFNVAVIEHPNASSSVHVFPNPGSGLFNISIDSKTPAHTVATVFDAIGKIVAREQFSFDSGIQNFTINLSGFSNGMYMLELISTDNKGGTPTKVSQKIQLIN